jgi:ATP-dependent DNA helicase Rep
LNKINSQQLNQQQLAAVNYVTGPLLVIAGAGSGKTKVITEKIIHLITSVGYSPKNVVAITFTNKAAKEMLERLKAKLAAKEREGLTITTFHSLGLKILKEEAHLLGYKPNFTILDSYDCGKIISDNLQTTDKALVRGLQHKISLWKNSFTSVDSLKHQAQDAVELQHAQVYEQYQATLKSYQAVDFDDLIILPIMLLEQNLATLYKWQQRIGYLLIDEYQDTNDSQYKLIKLLVAREQKFTAVGDDDQSIYGWRGANVENLRQLEQDFKQLKIIKLEQNYRSTNTILTAANQVIHNNNNVFAKKLWSEFGQGEAIKIFACKNDEEEAEMVVRRIKLHQALYNSKFSDYAILYRSNYQARILEQVLRNQQIPYDISGGQSFFEYSEIKDICAYLRLVVNEDDDVAFIRAITTPKRGIGSITLDKLTQYATTRQVSLFEAMFEEGFAQIGGAHQVSELLAFGSLINNLQNSVKSSSVNDLLQQLITAIHYEEYLYTYETAAVAEKKWQNVVQLVTWLGKKATNDERTLVDLVQMLTLITILDSNESQDIDAVKLSTLHAAKGLEYRNVYLISCNDGIIPHQESINLEKIDEERRLMYVGITRAQHELTISYCLQRKTAGELKAVEKSRFLQEMGTTNILDETLHKMQKIQSNNELNDRLQQLKNLLK